MIAIPRPSLLCATEPTGDILSVDNAPVWPARTPEELAALQTIATSFGGTIASCQTVGGSRLSGREMVLALGQEVAAEAELYAHLTGRQSTVAPCAKSLLAETHPAVVVTTEDRVTEALLEALYDRGPHSCATGLIYGATAEQLRRQVLIKSAAAYLSSTDVSPAVYRVDILPTSNLGYVFSPHWQLVGGRASPTEVQEAMSSPAGLMILVSHSDGIDSPLSDETVLCAVKGAPADAYHTADPECVLTRICHRRRESIETALKSNALIDPSVIRTRILIGDICWGLLPPLDVVHPAWGLGRRFLSNEAIGAFLTTWEITRTSIELITPLADAIAQGMPVGAALAEQLASKRWDKFARRMCLIGDPSVRLPRPPISLLVGQEQRSQAPVIRRSKVAALEFLRAYIALARQHVEGTYEDRSDEALAALHAYEVALWTGRSVEGKPDSPGSALREAFVRFAAGRFSLAYAIWQQFADDWTLLAPRPCFVCGRTADSALFRLCIPGASDRRVTNCQSCGTIEDVPSASELAFTVSSDGEVRLTGALPPGRCAGVLMLETSTSGRGRTFPWPNDAEGGLAPQVRAPVPWPEGPLHVGIVIISEGCELISLGRLCRGERLVSTQR